MKRFALTAVAALFSVVACQDMSTTPTVAPPELGVARGFGTAPSNPPPPPIDSGAVGIASESNENNETPVIFRVTYFFNKPENSGWLKFNKDEFDNTDIDNSAGIKFSSGVYTGKGVITIKAKSGLGNYVIDLSQVDFAKTRTGFGECTVAESPTLTSDGGSSCFLIDFGQTGASFVPKATGVPGAASLVLTVGRTTGTEVCSNDVVSDGCSISSER